MICTVICICTCRSCHAATDLVQDSLQPDKSYSTISRHSFCCQLPAETCYAALQGMLQLHNHNPSILHRDLKSPNLLVDKHWRVKVTDFNLSSMLRSEADTYGVLSSVANNPRWLAPEVQQPYWHRFVVWPLIMMPLRSDASCSPENFASSWHCKRWFRLHNVSMQALHAAVNPHVAG